MLFIVNHPGDFRIVDTILIGHDAARPDTRSDGVSTNTSAFAFKIFGAMNACVVPVNQSSMVKAAKKENRQCFERRTIFARDHVRGGCHFADVELDITDHPPKSGNDWLDLNKVGADAFNSDLALFERSSMAVSGDGDLEWDRSGGAHD